MDVVEIAAAKVSQRPHNQEAKPDLNEVVRSLLNTLSDDERKNLAKEILGQQKAQGTVSVVEESELLKGFISDSRNRGLAENSLVSYRSVLKRFSEYQRRRGNHIAKIDSSVLEGFLSELRELGFRYNTLSNYYSVLSSFCEYLVFRGLKDANPVPAFEKRYLRSYKKMKPPTIRKLISVEEMARLVNSTMNARDKAILVLLAKTGIRRGELVNIDMGDVDWTDLSIRLKPHPKRSNPIVFFDDETSRALRAWLRVRPSRVDAGCQALFVGETGKRLMRSGVYNMVTKQAEKAGFHDPDSRRTEDHFTPHCFRHFFTTMLSRSGIDKDLLKELRGDARRDSMDVYRHIDPEELRKAYLAHVPELGT